MWKNHWKSTGKTSHLGNLCVNMGCQDQLFRFKCSKLYIKLVSYDILKFSIHYFTQGGYKQGDRIYTQSGQNIIQSNVYILRLDLKKIKIIRCF